MQDELDQLTEERDKKAAYDALPVLTYEELKTVVDKWLLIIDPGLVKLVLATVIANRIDADPVWLFLLAPSGGGKTEIMNGLLKVPEYYSLSQLTPNTFLSGYKSKTKEPSLLKRLPEGATIGFKDFTSILDGNKDDMKDIMGQLRDLYDGHITKVTGTGDEIKWKGKIGFIAGCTPIIEERTSKIGAMGERFLNYKMQNPKRKDLRTKMRSNIGKEGRMRDEIQDAFAGYLKGVEIPSDLPSVPDEVDAVIESMTDFIAISRAVVMRSFDNKKEIEYIVEPEMSSRTYKQLYTISVALLIMNGGTWLPEDDYILKNLAISSVHSMRWNLIRHTLKYKTKVKTSTLAMELGYPTSTARRYLEDLAAISMDDGSIKILDRTHQGKGKSDLWAVTPAMKEILALMGEKVEPTKTDGDWDKEEEEIPITKPEGSDDDKQREVDDLTADMTEEEKMQLGLM